MDIIARLRSGRLIRAWPVGAWLALTPLAFADVPQPNPLALGVAEGVVNYCAPVDAASADKVRQVIKQLVQGASEQQLAEVRKSDDYRKAYDSVGDFTSKIDPHNAKRFCAETLAAPK
jgi:hypothetical protein